MVAGLMGVGFVLGFKTGVSYHVFGVGFIRVVTLGPRLRRGIFLSRFWCNSCSSAEDLGFTGIGCGVQGSPLMGSGFKGFEKGVRGPVLQMLQCDPCARNLNPKP